MIPGTAGSIFAGSIGSVVTDGQRGPELWAEIATGKMIQVADGAPPAIRDQAHAFRAALRRVIANYIRMAIDEDRAFLAAKLEREGHADLAQFVRNP
jgi:hypothetical protein